MKSLDPNTPSHSPTPQGHSSFILWLLDMTCCSILALNPQTLASYSSPLTSRHGHSVKKECSPAVSAGPRSTGLSLFGRRPPSTTNSRLSVIGSAEARRSTTAVPAKIRCSSFTWSPAVTISTCMAKSRTATLLTHKTLQHSRARDNQAQPDPLTTCRQDAPQQKASMSKPRHPKPLYPPHAP